MGKACHVRLKKAHERVKRAQVWLHAVMNDPDLPADTLEEAETELIEAYSALAVIQAEGGCEG